VESIRYFLDTNTSRKPAFRPHGIDSRYPEGLAYSTLSAASYTFVTPERQPSQVL